MATWRDKDGVERSGEVAGPRRIAAAGRWKRLSVRKLKALHWYAVLVKGSHEATVEALLERRGFIAVVPMWRLLRRASRYAERKIEVRKPVAPGYVLVGFRDTDLSSGMAPWHRVFDITMVSSVLGLEEDGYAWRLRGQQVADFLWANEDRPAAPDVQAAGSRLLDVDEKVVVNHGAFIGHMARVAASTLDSVNIIVTLFGREAEYCLPRAMVDPVGGD